MTAGCQRKRNSGHTDETDRARAGVEEAAWDKPTTKMGGGEMASFHHVNAAGPF